MAKSLSQILLHLVFSTKNREPWITPGVRSALHGYLAGAVRALHAEAYRVGGVADHVHIACTLPRSKNQKYRLTDKDRTRIAEGVRYGNLMNTERKDK